MPVGYIIIFCVRLCTFARFYSFGQCEGLKAWNGQQVRLSRFFLYKLIANEERPKAFVKTMQIVRFLTAVLLATLISLSSAAQINWWDSSKSNEGVSLSAQFGLNLSHFTHIDRWSDIKAGVNVGIIAEKPILKSLAVKAGVLYTMKGAIGNNDGGFGGRLITTLSPSYLEIPILASYRLQYNDDVRFTFDFGSSVVYKERYSAGLIFDCGAANISNMGGKVSNFTFMKNLGYKFYSL